MRACTFAHWCMCATHHCFCVCWALFKGHAFVQAQMMQLAGAWLSLGARPRWHTYRKPLAPGSPCTQAAYRPPARLLSGPWITAGMRRLLDLGLQLNDQLIGGHTMNMQLFWVWIELESFFFFFKARIRFFSSNWGDFSLFSIID